MTSIVIPFIHSKWYDQEIKFALRSVEKHLSNYGELFIVGDRPIGLKPDSYNYILTIPNTLRQFKERNIFMNVLAATMHSGLSDNFLFMNDDHFLMSDYDAQEFPNYYADWPVKSDLYKITMQNTINEIKRIVDLVNREEPDADMLDKDPEFYDVHCPMLMNKHYFRYINGLVDWDVRAGYCMKSLYGNFMNVKNERYPDLKIRWQHPPYDMLDMVKNRLWFSVDDQARGHDLEVLLKGLYPHKSKWEI